MGGGKGGRVGSDRHLGLGSIHLTRESYRTWFLVRPQAEFLRVSVSCCEILSSKMLK